MEIVERDGWQIGDIEDRRCGLGMLEQGEDNIRG